MKMKMKMKKILAIALLTGTLAACQTTGSKHEIKNQSDVSNIVSQIPSTTSADPWHFNNLYDPETKSFFIPYHLWTGAKWDGVKSTKDCMHSANNTWNYTNTKNRNKFSEVSGPVSFTNKETGKDVETWLVKLDENSEQNYICHEKGIARVYDKRPRFNIDQYMNGRECKFPAGFGWKIGEKVDCDPVAPRVTRIEGLFFDANFILQNMSFVYINKEGVTTRLLEDYYEYKPELGRVVHLKLKKTVTSSNSEEKNEGNVDPHKSRALKIITRVDSDGDNQISRDEWLGKKPMFKRADDDGDGYVTVDELTEFFASR